MVIGGRTPDVSGQTYFFFAPAVHPGLHPGRPHRRHGLRLHPPHGQGHRVPHPGQGPRAPPAPAPRPRTAPHGRHPVGVDGGAVGVLAVPAVLQAGPTPSSPSVSSSSAWRCTPCSIPGLRKDTPNGNGWHGPAQADRTGGAGRRRRSATGPARDQAGTDPTVPAVPATGDGSAPDARAAAPTAPGGREPHPVRRGARRAPGEVPPVARDLVVDAQIVAAAALVLPRTRGGCEDCGVRFPLPVGSDRPESGRGRSRCERRAHRVTSGQPWRCTAPAL